MDPTPIVDTETGVLLLFYNAHPAHLNAFVELADENITTTLYVIKVPYSY